MKTRHIRNNGFMLVEASISLALLFALTVLVILVAIEASKAYFIGRNMTEGAEIAARALATAYHNDPSCNVDGTQNAIFTSIRIPNMINNNAQFTITQWNTTPNPPTNPKIVTVQVDYVAGGGSPPLPQYPSPNPLNIKLLVSGQATYALQ